MPSRCIDPIVSVKVASLDNSIVANYPHTTSIDNWSIASRPVSGRVAGFRRQDGQLRFIHMKISRQVQRHRMTIEIRYCHISFVHLESVFGRPSIDNDF